LKIKILLNNGEVKEEELEEYLRCVVPAEIPALWHKQVLKAMAIAARTYAVYCILHSRHFGLHLCAKSHCQNYNPLKIHPLSDEAIFETSGLIITYKKDVINAVYHACCDGRTKNNEEVFKGPAVPYLRGVECLFSPSFNVPPSGHGVGLCQRGALKMAEHYHCSFMEILKHYYSSAIEVVPLEKALKNDDR
jgi:peptidoglycan hydrolase-like amidase